MSCAELAPSVAARHDELSFHVVADGGDDPIERRLERWITRNLQDDPADTAPDPWRGLLGDQPGLRRAGDRRGKSEAPKAKWARFRLSRRRDVTLLRLTDRGLTRDVQIQELTDDLLAVIEAGHTRILLDFAEVERLSSWVVGAVARAQKACERVPGGALK